MRGLFVVLLVSVTAGCAAPGNSVDPMSDLVPTTSELVAEESRFEGEFRAMLALESPQGGTPCGGLILGAADGTGHEWRTPDWTARVTLRLEVEAPAGLSPVRLCLIDQGGEEIVVRGVPPLELQHVVNGAHSFVVATLPDEESPSLVGPGKFHIVAVAHPDVP